MKTMKCFFYLGGGAGWKFIHIYKVLIINRTSHAPKSHISSHQISEALTNSINSVFERDLSLRYITLF